MAEAEYDHNIFSPEMQDEADKGLLVKFEVRPKLNQQKSKEAGRRIYEDRVYVNITVPGTRESVIRPATQRDINRFPEHYRRFQARVEEPEEGTPLKEWPLVSRSLAEELSFLKIRTVEQLANITDNAASNIMGGNNLKQEAKDWLARAEQNVSMSKMERELKSRDKTIAELEKRLAALESEEEEIDAADDDGDS